jgi:hypothetical protein
MLSRFIPRGVLTVSACDLEVHLGGEVRILLLLWLAEIPRYVYQLSIYVLIISDCWIGPTIPMFACDYATTRHLPTAFS